MQANALAIRSPVATRCARHHAGRREGFNSGNPRQVRVAQMRAQASAACQFKRMTEQAEACHVSERVHAGQCRQIRSRTIKLGGVSDHRCIACIVELVFLQGGGKHAHAEGLAQHQYVACARRRVTFHSLWMHHAERSEAINRFY